LTQISGWGRYPRADVDVVAPVSIATARAALHADSDRPLIARGLGRSYGDSALAPRVMSTRNLDLLLDFSEGTGQVRCGAGVSLAELTEVFLPRGWFLPVTPGTKFVTVGGAIASDVHGKNHHVDGCFSNYVDRFELLAADGEVLTCSRTTRPELFNATCGGMGLTGIILEAALRLRRVSSAFIEQTTFKTGNIRDTLALFEAHQHHTYSVAWIDNLASGAALGRSLLMVGDHVPDAALRAEPRRSVSIPMDMPTQLLNHYTIRAFNALYYHRVQREKTQRRVSYEEFFYPLDRIHHWNRLYGKRGFTQYQFVIPKSAGLEGLTTIAKRIAASQRGSFLSVLKLFGSANANPLSFPMEGYTLALDFKVEEPLFALLDELDAIVLDFGGRLYLAKDARMRAATFKRSYSGWEQFQDIRARYHMQERFRSHQSRRLGLD
jgi:decaprenylphospho-beta-D-ribofuranose 2-oxidase